MIKNIQGFSLIILAPLLGLLVIASVLYLLRPTNYEKCINFPFSKKIEMVPPTCISMFGQDFRLDATYKQGNELQDTKDKDINSWKTYTNDRCSFQISYPQNWNAHESLVENVGIIYFKPVTNSIFDQVEEYSLVSLEIVTTRKEIDSIDDYIDKVMCPVKRESCNPEKAEKTTIGDGITAEKLETNVGYPETKVIIKTQTLDRLFPNTYITFTLRKDDAFENLYSKSEKESILNDMLSTFKFINKDNYTNMIDISSWKEITFNAISFKIPPEGSCNQTNAITMYCQTEPYQKGRNNPNVFYLQVQDYLGGSRREQFNAEEACHPLFIESKFGNIDALEIPYEAGQCQGIDGAIVAVVGDKLVSFINHKYDPTTKEVIRWDTLDTIISTLRSQD